MQKLIIIIPNVVKSRGYNNRMNKLIIQLLTTCFKWSHQGNLILMTMSFPILSGYYFKCKQKQWKITNFYCVDFKRGILINSLISFFILIRAIKKLKNIFLLLANYLITT